MFDDKYGTFITGDDLPYACLPDNGTYDVNLKLDAAGLEELKKALKENKKSPKDMTQEELLNDSKKQIKKVHEIWESEGKTLTEKADNYINKKEKEVKEKITRLLGSENLKKVDEENITCWAYPQTYNLKHRY